MAWAEKTGKEIRLERRKEVPSSGFCFSCAQSTQSHQLYVLNEPRKLSSFSSISVAGMPHVFWHARRLPYVTVIIICSLWAQNGHTFWRYTFAHLFLEKLVDDLKMSCELVNYCLQLLSKMILNLFTASGSFFVQRSSHTHQQSWQNCHFKDGFGIQAKSTLLIIIIIASVVITIRKTLLLCKICTIWKGA